jgi:hypothetical protein
MDAPCDGRPRRAGRRLDADTACQVLRGRYIGVDYSPRVTLHRLGSERPSETFRGAQASQVLEVLVGALDAGHIAKFFKPGPRAQESFLAEISMMRDLRRVYGRSTEAYTTVRPVALNAPSLRLRADDVCAVHVSGGGGREGDARVVFSGRCDMEAADVRFDDALAERFVVDVLESMRMLHEGGVIHGDVKFQNMVKCTAGRLPSPRFKLIDWELSGDARKLRRGFVSGAIVKNYASPLAWRMWGLPKRLSVMTFIAYYAYKHTKWVVHEPGFFADLVSVAASYEAFHGSVSAEPLAALYDRYFATFDLFNFGVMLFAMARDSSNGLRGAMRGRLAALARRLTHYGDADFCASAGEALRCWSAGAIANGQANG